VPDTSGPLTSIFLVELPGIESDKEIALTCGNAGFPQPKRRENTRRDLRLRERC
jgi:hypothetical protein